MERRRLDDPADGRRRLDGYLLGVADLGRGDLVGRTVGRVDLDRRHVELAHLVGYVLVRDVLVGHVLVRRRLVDVVLGLATPRGRFAVAGCVCAPPPPLGGR